MPLCNATDLCYEECSNEIHNCTSTKFNTGFSSPTAPFSWIIDDIKEFVNSLNVPLSENWEESRRTEIPNSYVPIDFACESFMVERFEQS
ncbi:unnamed protein product [Adineta ricciae]|uniref:Uncharacterized protein n=1 Tax=Adineta ricciae TaxID=249248 RepID=A0A815IXJ4_ADIRI|nr:unnamed protein product [Adineta ricciae]CAF1613800.1 unnamed protein product [Adineta ricciae]